ncbi:hypothetical protein [Desulforamulus profundi]|nr:hypothetical protein [Desulforamulus profundi]
MADLACSLAASRLGSACSRWASRISFSSCRTDFRSGSLVPPAAFPLRS